MRTALDTNVLSALWSKEPVSARVVEVLERVKVDGGLVVSGPVYAELLAHPKATETFVNNFLADTGIAIDFDIERSVWIDSAQRFARYADRRRRSKGEQPKRLLTDFVIGSHALRQADRLMTLDPKRYQRDFPELKII